MMVDLQQHDAVNGNLKVYIGERNFDKIEHDTEIDTWYKNVILDHIWEIKPEHTGIILWPCLDIDGDFRLIMINILRESFSSWRVGTTEVLYSWDITKFYQSKHKSKTSYKKCGKYDQIFNQDGSKVQLPHKIFFDTKINDKYKAFLYFVPNELLFNEQSINDDIINVLKNVKFSFDKEGFLTIKSNLKIEPFIEE